MPLIKSRLEMLYKQAKEMQMDNPEFRKQRANNNYNCHGMTLYVMGLKDQLEWVNYDELRTILNRHKEASKIKHVKGFERTFGEVLGLAFDEPYYAHTAVYVGNGQYMQKTGEGPLTLGDYNHTRQLYPKGKAERLIIK